MRIRNEMKEALENNLCSRGGDMLAYLYNEMPAADRETFELHMADCGTCIDEFAELSQSRYPVFEWKQLEFDPLPTPRVVIPFEAVESYSWFNKLRAAFAFRPAAAFGGLAAFAVVATLAAFVLIGGSGETNEIAGARPTATPAASISPSRPTEPNPVVAKAEEPQESRPNEPKAVKASTSVSKPAVRPVKPKTTQPTKRNSTFPTLGSTEDDEDDSLRLADIFDEIDTSE